MHCLKKHSWFLDYGQGIPRGGGKRPSESIPEAKSPVNLNLGKIPGTMLYQAVEFELFWDSDHFKVKSLGLAK